MNMPTALQNMLGLAVPLIQAPMAGAQGSALAVAVCEAGALGSLPAAMLSPMGLREELAAIESRTSRPYNVNFFCHAPPVPDSARELRWRQTLAPYYAEYAIDPNSLGSGPSRQPFNAESAEVLEAFKPAVVSFHFGLPAPPLLERVRRMGAKILSSATTVEEALWLQARGIDAIIAQGLEAGGHRGMFLTDDLHTQVGTFALLPQIVKAVQIPVIAAGGIADAQAVAAALAMGAAGVQIGTAYLLCTEASTSTVHRAALKSTDARLTALTNVYTGRPARGIVNRLMREIGPISAAAPPFPLATAAVSALRAQAESQGSGDFSPLWAGQNVSGCREISATRLTRQLAGLSE
jgi:nitronate monooxygenase